MEFIKKAKETAEFHRAEVRETVQKVLEDIEAHGEPAVRELALRDLGF
jgi:sulfopropanediol 3-dehydrogenase